jgi:hypothetical protein
MESMTYTEIRIALDKYYEKKAEKIRQLYDPENEMYSAAFRHLGSNMVIIEDAINAIFGFAEDDPHAVKRPQRMD